MTLKLLVADDARDVADIVAFGARMVWPDCAVTVASDGATALAAFAEERPDLVVLDVAMPQPDGFEVCRSIRAVSPVPILMLTVREATVDKIRALDLGADDYLTKPFDHLELLARLRALVRRATDLPPAPSPTQERERFVLDDFALDYATHEVHVAQVLVQLTSTEYRLLEELVRHAGSVLTHQHLLERVWGAAYVNDTHYLKVFVQRLRHKLGDDPRRPRFIHTEWGIGYQFTPPR
jgi:two-component system KDP operon response regulator KdpE